MKKLYYLIILTVILGLVLTGCTLLSNISQVPATEQSGITYLTKGGVYTLSEYTLYADQDIPVGTVNVWNDFEKLYVQYIVDDPWEMTGSHLYVGKTDPANFPSTPGQFPYSPGMEKSPSPNASYYDATMTYTIYLNEIDDYEFVGKGQGKGLNAMGTPGVVPGDEIYIAAQAEVFRSSEGNVLENPDAEDSMNGWNYTFGVVRAIDTIHESTGWVLPRSGGYFFDMSESQATDADMSQGVNVAGFDGASFKASGWIQTEWYPEETDDSITANDYGRLVVTFYDNSNDELESFTTGPIGNPVSGTGSEGYAQFSLEGNIPDGAVTAIYELHGTLVLPGSYLNVFYDDLSFECWQEETAWAVDDDVLNFGKNWATYFTYEIAGPFPTISSADLAGPYDVGETQQFNVRTINPVEGFDYSAVLFNYTIFGIDPSDILIFDYYYYDGANWVWGNMPKFSDGSGNVVGYFGDPTTGFPMSAPYDETTTFRINITNSGTYTVVITLDNLVDPCEVLALFTQDVVFE